MNTISFITTIIEYLLFFYFGIASLYILIFALAGLFPRKQKMKLRSRKRKFAVLIPGYKEDAVIVEVAGEALLQKYPKDLFDVIIIADSFRPETLRKLKSMPLKVIEVVFKVSTKSKALNQAMARLESGYDCALILDADNLMEKNFLSKINEAFENGYRAVQGHRIAGNSDTPFAQLDAISEEVNNHIFRKGHRNLGLSAALIGSGMAFEYTFFKETMSRVKAVGGFDKELELKLLKEKIKIEYIHEALVMDEKIRQASGFAKQRKRWLSAQFIYFRRFFFQGLYHLVFKGNIDFFDKVYQMISPPRILLIGLTALITLFYGITGIFDPEPEWLRFSFMEWAVVFIMVIVAFLFSIPRKFYNRQTLSALSSLPIAFWLMFGSLFKLKGANKKFIHTAHGMTNPEKK